MNSTTTGIVAGVPAGVLAAACFGSSAVLQYRVAHEVPERGAGRPILLLDLVRHSRWRWSIVLAVAGFGLQVLALRLAPLILVQPLLVTGVLWYVLLSAKVYHRPPDRLIVLGTLVCLTSLSAFLALAQPSEGGGANRLDSVWRALPLAIGLAVALTACLVLAAGFPRWRALPLSLATGICYGVTAGFVRSLSSHFGEGLTGILGHWQTYAIIVLGPLGVILNQNSYQAGRIGAPALTVITVTDPLVSIAIGLLWLGESIQVNPDLLVGEVLALIALTGGVALLALRAPHVAGWVPDQRPGQRAPGGRPTDVPAADSP
jgi:drug/metabolite transporter (DMT)-like permease